VVSLRLQRFAFLECPCKHVCANHSHLQHYVGNEQELYRNPTLSADNETIESLSSNMDDKTMHELYLWPFQDAVHAGTGSIMCSYNRLNNSYGCQNSKALNGLLKGELGFEGFVVSDWFAQHSGVASANSGLDMVMPTGATYWASNLTQAVQNGSVSTDRMDDIATRILAAWYQLGQDNGDYAMPGFGMPQYLNQTHEIIDARDPAARPTILQSAIEGHVLVKNTNNVLPLKSPKLLSLYGYSARSPAINDPLPAGFSDWNLGGSSVEGGAAALICGFTAAQPNCPPAEAIAANGTLLSGGGSGAITPWYISDPHSALVQYASDSGVALFWDYTNVNATGFVSAMTDACLVFINAFATEGADRPNLADTYSDMLVNNIADQCANTIVIIHNAGIRLVDGFYDHPNVTGIIYAHLPGQESGKATVDVLFGAVSPSGKMPYTVARIDEDYGSLLHEYTPGTEDQLFPQDDFSEGSLIDYRAFDAMGIEPRFEFGFGLSYGNFSYSNLQVSTTGYGPMGMYPTGEIMQGGRTDLWDVVATVSCEVMNSGSMEAAEVAQLYLTIPGMTVNIPSQAAPVGKQLRGFDKQTLAPGASATFTFELTRRDISVWDVVAQEWAVNTGTYTVEVGSSSRTLPLSGTMMM
jgi:beta-glucosidase